MRKKIVKFITGAILAQSIALGVTLGLVWIIPIRGTVLAIIVCPISCGVMLFFTSLAGIWAFGGEGEQTIS